MAWELGRWLSGKVMGTQAQGAMHATDPKVPHKKLGGLHYCSPSAEETR